MRIHVAILGLLLLPSSVVLAQEAKPKAPAVGGAQAQPGTPPQPQPAKPVAAPAPTDPATVKPEPVVEPAPIEPAPVEPEPVAEPVAVEPEPVAVEPEPVAEPATVEPEPAPEELEPAEEEAPKKAKSALVKPSPHQGHYIALGLHGTSAYANDRDRGGRGPAFGTGYSLRLGERVTSWLDLGIALAYASVGGDDPWSFGRLTVHAQVYPSEHYFVHGGFGFGAAGGDDPEDPGFSRGRFGDVYTAGVGRNFYLTDKSKSGGWIVTPIVTAEYGRDDQFPNAALWVGVEISHWWGISRNQLDLSFDEAYK